MNLYRKYRPNKFEDMLGNREEIESLQSTLNRKDRPHVYLFHGVSGAGKTTAARIAAKMIDDNESSIVEINSSNNRGIDTARQIIEQMQCAPFGGTATIFIIDEVHQTSKDWQDAMLKPLEDTPNHIYFFLCTTNPEKLKQALRTRCSEFHFPSLDKKYLIKLMRTVCREENKNVSDEILEEISVWSQGSPRKSLVLLEKIIDMDSESALRLLEKGMSDEDDEETIELCRALIDRKNTWGTVAELIKKLSETDMEKIRYSVLGYMQNVLLSGKENTRAAIAIESFSEPFYNTNKAGLVLACYQTVNMS